MTVAPQVVLLVHGTFERDPRVRRHAAAARDAGYRVAVLSVGSEREHPRWGEQVDGIAVFESRSTDRTIAGRLRVLVSLLRRSRTNTGPADQNEGSRHAVGAELPNSVPPLARSSWRDLLDVALLIRQNIAVFRQFRGVGGRVVHANDLNVLPAGVLLARYWRAALLYDSHELWTETNPAWSPFQRKLLSLLERLIIRRCDAVVTVNNAVARELAHRYGIQQPVVVMNCPEWSDTVEMPRSVRLPGRPLRVVYLGMLNEARGLQPLIDAAAATQDVELTIIGHGSQAAAVAAHAGRLNQNGRIRVLPPVDVSAVLQTLRAFDVGVIPYPAASLNMRLSSPVKLFEYMAAGLAVVASDLPVIREIIEATGCGVLVQPANIDDLTTALTTLASDPETVTAMGAAGMRAARDTYNAAAEHKRLLHIYARLIRGAGHLDEGRP